MNSHVQLPKFFIRNFCCRQYEEKVYVYDFRNGTVHLDDPEFIGTMEDYYNEETEIYLSLKYETPFYKIAYSLITWEKEGAKGDVPISSEQWKDIKRFIMELRFRSPFIRLKLLKKHGPDDSFDPSFLVRGHDTDENLEKFFPDHVLAVVTNETIVPFISSIRGYGQFFPYRGISDKNWWCPISPKVAIACVDSLTFRKYFGCQSHSLFVDEGQVEYFNGLMLHQARTEYRKVINLKGFENYYACLFSDDFFELKRLQQEDERRISYEKRKAERKGKIDS